MRHDSSRSMRRLAVLVAILALGGGVAAAAPSLFGAPIPSAAAANRAAVILVDRLEIPANVAALRPAGVPGPRAIVIRRPTTARGARNLILVTGETRPDDLDKAVSQLSTSMRRSPRIIAETRAYISPARGNPTAGKDRARAANDLRRLAAAREHHFTGVGRHKAIGIRLKSATAPAGASLPRVSEVRKTK